MPKKGANGGVSSLPTSAMVEAIFWRTRWADAVEEAGDVASREKDEGRTTWQCWMDAVARASDARCAEGPNLTLMLQLLAGDSCYISIQQLRQAGPTHPVKHRTCCTTLIQSHCRNLLSCPCLA